MKMKVGLVSLLVAATLALAMDAGLAAPGDIVFERSEGGKGFPVAVFPHWAHRIRFRCYVCHPKIFEMKKGANKVTMDAIGKGKFCGACHNGKIAWKADFASCNKCHVGQ